MLNSAEITMHSIADQASALEKRVAQVQEEKSARLAKQKSVFEEKLKAQEQANRALAAQSNNITQQISQLRQENGGITNYSKGLQFSNKIKRDELGTIASRLEAARRYVADSIAATDDAGAAELGVLLSPGATPRLKVQAPTVAAVAAPASAPAAAYLRRQTPTARAVSGNARDAADDVGETDDEDDDDGAVLLAVGSSTVVAKGVEPAGGVAVSAPRAKEVGDAGDTPGSVVASLKNAVEDLSKQELEGEARLKSLFFDAYQAGAKRHSMLVSTQTELNATRDALVVLRARLQAAQSRLEKTSGSLDSRLGNLAQFVKQLGELAAAPSTNVPTLVANMPKDVGSK